MRMDGVRKPVTLSWSLMEVIPVILQFQRIGVLIGEYPASLDIIPNTGVAGPQRCISPILLGFAKSFYKWLYISYSGVIGFVDCVFLGSSITQSLDCAVFGALILLPGQAVVHVLLSGRCWAETNVLTFWIVHLPHIIVASLTANKSPLFVFISSKVILKHHSSCPLYLSHLLAILVEFYFVKITFELCNWIVIISAYAR